MKKIITIIALAAMTLGVVACVPDSPAKSTKQTQSQKAAKAAQAITFTENAEIDNIKARLELTSSPSMLGYVALMNEMGQVVMYTGVKGKITSSGKRLTVPVQKYKIDRGANYGTTLGPAPSDEGTWGSSSPYIYFWTTNGQYIQWSGKYLYSDQPFRLSAEPLLFASGEAGVKKTNN